MQLVWSKLLRCTDSLESAVNNYEWEVVAQNHLAALTEQSYVVLLSIHQFKEFVLMMKNQNIDLRVWSFLSTLTCDCGW